MINETLSVYDLTDEELCILEQLAFIDETELFIFADNKILF